MLIGGISPVVHEKQDYEFVDKYVSQEPPNILTVSRTLHVSSLATSSAGGFNCATSADYTVSDLLKNTGMANGHTAGCHVDIVVKSELKNRLFKGTFLKS
jgi:hypothetical protein